MDEAAHGARATFEPVRITNREGRNPVLIVCDHASNHLPAEFGTLGLPPSELSRHIAWDPGAAPVSRKMSEMLDATLIESAVSRLVVDCNRPLDAPDLIWEVSETTAIPGNFGLTPAERAHRVAVAYTPYHQAIDAEVSARLAAGRATWLVAIHSFTPVYRGVARPWQVGVIHDQDQRLARPLIAALEAEGGLTVGANQPYAPKDRVYFTLERHARSRNLPCVMIEIRNDEIADERGQRRWAERLAGIFRAADPSPAAS